MLDIWNTGNSGVSVVSSNVQPGFDPYGDDYNQNNDRNYNQNQNQKSVPVPAIKPPVIQNLYADEDFADFAVFSSQSNTTTGQKSLSSLSPFKSRSNTNNNTNNLHDNDNDNDDDVSDFVV